MSCSDSSRKAICRSCGHEGVYTSSSDERGRTEEHWQGFETVPASDYEYFRGRSEARIPVCKCGSKNIIIGVPVSDRDR